MKNWHKDENDKNTTSIAPYKDPKSQLSSFGLNPREWRLRGPYPCPKKSRAQWQGLFVHLEDPQFQFWGLWKKNGLLELHAVV